MSNGEGRSTAATLFMFLLIGLAVVVLFKLGLVLLGVVVGGVLAAFGLGIAVVIATGTLVVFLSVVALPFVLLGWLATVGWRLLFGQPRHV